MNPLIKKEIRLLLPRWLTVLSLGILLPWLWKYDGSIINFSPVVLFFGTILLTLDSFGSEFSFGTFSSLMSQPIERQTPIRQRSSLAQRNERLDNATKFLGFGQRGLDGLVLQQRVAHVAQHRLAMLRSAIEFAKSVAVTHGAFSFLY